MKKPTTEKPMRRWRVTGSVRGGKYLGEFEARTQKAAEELALNSENAGSITLCHGCSDECEDGTVEAADAELVGE